MPLNAFISDVLALEPLVQLVRLGSMNQKTLRDAGLDVGLLNPASAGCVVLMVGRFEQFLKDIGNKALDQYGSAVPPVLRSSLPTDLQIKILSNNFNAAAQAKRYGSARPSVTRVKEVDQVANKIANNEVWGDHAIETFSNPNSDTVKSIMLLLGLSAPWTVLESNFAPRWALQQAQNTYFKSVPNAQNELDNILGWRNAIAHTNSLPNVGAKELEETAAFLDCLAQAIDESLRTHIATSIADRGSTPPAW